MKNRFLRILIVTIVAGVILLLIVKTYAPKKAENPSSKTAPVTANSKEKILKPSVEISDTLDETFISADLKVAYELPACAASLLTKHEGYTLQYDEKNEQARWVAYQLTAAETIKQYERTNKFIADPTIPSGSASDRDYRNSGYDRGHLAPAADMGWSAQTMAESFYYSNMSPQVPAFNRGIWKRLEEQVRSWAMELDTIYVVTGPILSGNLQFIGPDQVAVPNYYFKAVFYFHGKDSKAIGFVMENRKLQGSLYDYTITIDSLEKLTGLDLFASVDDQLETKIERTTCTACWDWNVQKQTTSVRKDSNLSNSVQCSGITRSNNRCKRRTKNQNGRCYQHQ
jgi:endonuclease G